MLCTLLASPVKIDRRSRAHQHRRHAILRRALRSRVAANANALLAAPDPEPSMLLPNHRALRIQQRKPDRFVSGVFTKKEPSLSTGAVPVHHRVPSRVHRLQPHLRRSHLQIARP